MSYFHRFPLVSEFFEGVGGWSSGAATCQLGEGVRDHRVTDPRETDRTAEEFQGLFKFVRSVVLSSFSA